MAESALQRIQALDEERGQLIAAAKQEALDKANAAIAELQGLGFSYRLLEAGKGRGGVARRGARTVKDADCPVCKFRTSPPHDARRHRSQRERKRPFTASELKEMEMTKA
jgi:hypothetical protein